MLRALLLGFGQLADPAFRRPLLLGGALALAGGIGLSVLAGWGVEALAGTGGWLGTLVAAAGALVVLVALWWVFVPLLLAIAGLFTDGVAAAVERRHYPALPPASGAPAAAQAWGAAVLALRLGLVTLALLPLSLLLPGIGLVLLWAVAAIGLGEGLFEGVAQRRMDRPAARALIRRRRAAIWGLGAVLAGLAAIAPLNLLVPVVGTAAMTHLLHRR